MPSVELVWDADCPNVAEARANLRAALGSLGAPAAWTEWDRADPAAPARARAFGSPAILIDGRDVVGSEPSDACCRVYSSDGRLSGAPSVAAIAAALRAALGAAAEPATRPQGGE